MLTVEPEVDDLFSFQDEAEALCIQVKHKRPAPLLAVGPKPKRALKFVFFSLVAALCSA
jgi:hypothetical protein